LPLLHLHHRNGVHWAVVESGQMVSVDALDPEMRRWVFRRVPFQIILGKVAQELPRREDALAGAEFEFLGLPRGFRFALGDGAERAPETLAALTPVEIPVPSAPVDGCHASLSIAASRSARRYTSRLCRVSGFTPSWAQKSRKARSDRQQKKAACSAFMYGLSIAAIMSSGLLTLSPHQFPDAVPFVRRDRGPLDGHAVPVAELEIEADQLGHQPHYPA